MATEQPTPEQLTALQDYARRHGRSWKERLAAAWSNGRDVHEPDGHLLRQVRNTLGPEWLLIFKLPG